LEPPELTQLAGLITLDWDSNLYDHRDYDLVIAYFTDDGSYENVVTA